MPSLIPICGEQADLAAMIDARIAIRPATGGTLQYAGFVSRDLIISSHMILLATRNSWGGANSASGVCLPAGGVVQPMIYRRPGTIDDADSLGNPKRWCLIHDGRQVEPVPNFRSWQ